MSLAVNFSRNGSERALTMSVPLTAIDTSTSMRAGFFAHLAPAQAVQRLRPAEALAIGSRRALVLPLDGPMLMTVGTSEPPTV